MAAPTNWQEVRKVGEEALGPLASKYEFTEDYDPYADGDDLNMYARQLLTDSSADKPLTAAGESGTKYTRVADDWGEYGREPYDQGELFIQETYSEPKIDPAGAAAQYSRDMAASAARKITQDSSADTRTHTPATIHDFIARRDTSASYGERLLRDQIGARANIQSTGVIRTNLDSVVSYIAPKTVSLNTDGQESVGFIHGGMKKSSGMRVDDLETDQDTVEALIANASTGRYQRHKVTQALRYLQQSQDPTEALAVLNKTLAGTFHKSVSKVTRLADVPADELGQAVLAIKQAQLISGAATAAGMRHRTEGSADVESSRGYAKSAAGFLATPGGGRDTDHMTILSPNAHLQTASEMMLAARSADFNPAHTQRAKHSRLDMSAKAGSGLSQGRGVLMYDGAPAPTARALAAVRERSHTNAKTFKGTKVAQHYRSMAPVQSIAGVSVHAQNPYITDKSRTHMHATGLLPSTGLAHARMRQEGRETQVVSAVSNAASRPGGGAGAMSVADRSGATLAAMSRAAADEDFSDPFSRSRVKSEWAAL